MDILDVCVAVLLIVISVALVVLIITAFVDDVAVSPAVVIIIVAVGTPILTTLFVYLAERRPH